MQQRADVEVKLGEVELLVADAESIITTRDKEISELKVALEEIKNKYYNMGFNDAKNWVKPIMFENRKYRLCEGWMVAVTAIGLTKDSPFRNPN